jgi:hypothetical protein
MDHLTVSALQTEYSFNWKGEVNIDLPIVVANCFFNALGWD